MIIIETINGSIQLNDGFSYKAKGYYVNIEATPTTTSIEVLFIDHVTTISHQGSFIVQRTAPTETWVRSYVDSLPWAQFGNKI